MDPDVGAEGREGRRVDEQHADAAIVLHGIRIQQPVAAEASSMDVRRFGNTDLRVSEYGFGCARIGGIFQRDSAGFVDLLTAARDAGITFYDTADMYSQGESEALIGRAFRRQRDKIVIATKAGYCLPAQRRFIARIKPFVRPLIRLLKLKRTHLPAAVRGALAQDFSPGYLTRALEDSLKRLKTDHVDLLQLHSPPAEIVERGDWVDALERLKRAGKIRYYGVACDTVDAALAALRYPGVSSLQVAVNLLERRAAEAVLPRAREQGVAIIARETLANGLLVKEADEIDLKKYCQSPEQESLRVEQLERYRAEARGAGETLARHALGYVTRLDGVSVSLLGASRLGQLRSLLRELPSR
jgi:aryl-alcohol dehydrogenase-like predicted oxidoreductase